MPTLVDILRARFLINEGAAKIWGIILYTVFWCLLLIWNIQRYEEKVFLVGDLTHEIKMLRAEFVDTRSELMKLKMESTITRSLEEQGIFPSETPPTKIKVIKEKKQDSFWNKLWR